MTELATLTDWLEFISRQHPQAIAFGLDRVNAVRLALNLELSCPIIIVGGTNGKGSACMMLEAILSQAHYRVGTYTSPHLLRYNERVRLSSVEASDEDLIEALSVVEQARSRLDVALTYFEFTTLAAAYLFKCQGMDAVIFEVGLGGRLDAVNIFDADVAVLMSVDLDHMEYLGATREAIGAEKACIFRGGKTAVCADSNPPASVLEYAAKIDVQLLCIDRDFDYQVQAQQWQYQGPNSRRYGLPLPALLGRVQLANASACIAALDALRSRLPVSAENVRTGLLQVSNPGRFQVMAGRPTVILDVAHNPHAAKALVANLIQMTGYDRTIAIFSMLNDKNIPSVVQIVRGHIDQWLVAPLEGVRATPTADLVRILAEGGVVEPPICCVNIHDACDRAYQIAGENDRILIFGSFLTVAAAMNAVQ